MKLAAGYVGYKGYVRYVWVCLAMTAFAGNSLLNRLALATGASDATSFTAVRLASAAIMLLLLVWWLPSKTTSSTTSSNTSNPAPKSIEASSNRWLPWLSAAALFIYAAGFSWAYLRMTAATGALVLFGAVQLTMVLFALLQGERLRVSQWLGFCLAVLGMLLLTVPTFSTPSAASALAMLSAGVAWGVYSLLGRRASHPLQTTRNNFVRTLPMAAALVLTQYASLSITLNGMLYALLSGALTSGIGYAIWYRVLPSLRPTNAAAIQLSVPVIAVLAGAALLGEPITAPVVLACVTILGGMGLVLLGKTPAIK